MRPEDVPASWTEYVRAHNIATGWQQVKYLKETLTFYQDNMLSIADLQTDICKRLLLQWGIPETVTRSRDYIAGKGGRVLHPASPHAAHPCMFRYAAARGPPPPLPTVAPTRVPTVHSLPAIPAQ